MVFGLIVRGLSQIFFPLQNAISFWIENGPPGPGRTRISSARGRSAAAARRRKAEYLLIDRPRSGKTASPTAAVDWTLAAGLARTRPKTLLAGALSPDNVGDAIRRVRPWGVDASSGLEISPGVKDPGLIRGFFAAVRQADERRGSER